LGKVDLQDCTHPKNGTVSQQEYSCSYLPKVKIEPGQRLFALMPEDHPWSKKFKTRIVSLGVFASSMNDNTWIGPLIDSGAEKLGMKLNSSALWGDDAGTTFGVDYGGELVLHMAEKKTLVVRMNKRMRQMTQQISGKTYLDRDQGLMRVSVNTTENWGEKISEVPLSLFHRNLNNYEENFLFNQASLTAHYLEVDLVLDQPVLDLGFGAGIKTLDDTQEQKGAKLQDGWHKAMDIYRYNWEDFSNLIVDGVYHYVTLTPQASVDVPEVEFFNGSCALNSSIGAGATINIPTQKNSFKLNPIQPFVKSRVNVGVIPHKKYDTGVSRIEFEVETLIDPLNQTPLNVDSGAIGSVSAEVSYNQPLGSRTMLTVVPIRMYFPIYGKKDAHSLLSDKVRMVDGLPVRTQINEKEFTADWITLKLVQRMEPFPKK
jgi:hypothetical protein